jgi:outer membrane putative beta-barrel porin/alpha-amylase
VPRDSRIRWISSGAFALLLACALSPASTVGQCPETPKDGIVANPNRPTVANPADITQYGVLEVEYGYDHVAAQLGERDNNLVGLLKFAVTCNLEIRWSTNTLLSQTIAGMTETGFGDHSVGFQYRFAHQKKFVPSVAVAYALEFPTASVSKGLGTGKYDHQIQFLASKDIHNFHFDFNTSYFFFGRPTGGGTDQNAEMNLTFSHSLYKKLGLQAEFYGDFHFNNATPGYVDGLWALTYNVTPRLVLDSGIDHGFTASAPFRKTYFVGVTYSILDVYKALRRR